MKISESMYSLALTVKKENWTVINFIEYAYSISLDGVFVHIDAMKTFYPHFL